MSFKWIKKPTPVVQKNPITGEPAGDGKPVGLKELWEGTLVHDKRVSANYKSIRSAHNVSDAFENPLKGRLHEWFKVADADYDLLKMVAEEPQGLRPDKEAGYPGGAFVQVYSLVAAVMDATSDEPDDLKPDPTSLAA